MGLIKKVTQQNDTFLANCRVRIIHMAEKRGSQGSLEAIVVFQTEQEELVEG
jgi:hypothetical protein